MSYELAVILTTLAIYTAGTISPGPNFTLIVRLAASGSRPAALGATLGFSIGAAAYATLAMTGMALVITRIGWLMTAVQVAGGCYLIYLGIAAWITSSPKPSDASVRIHSAKRGFRMGLLVELSNPKSIAFFGSIFAVSVPADIDLWVKATILLCGFIVDVTWYGLASALLSTGYIQIFYSQYAVGIERALGVIIASFGIRIIAEKF